jgi:type IV pilus assembly protein PilP
MWRARLHGRCAALALVLAACESESVVVGRGVGLAASGDAPPVHPGAAVGGAGAGAESESESAGGNAGAGGNAAASPEEGLSYRDEDFVEADTNRDPFRNFASLFVARPTRAESVQREVIMARTSIDEMRLIAIISGVANPSAMFVDRDGTGYTVHRGDYIGRAEVVQTGGEDAVPVALNWRVGRIRPDEVVLTREDPTAPNRPPLTRVVPLRGDEAASLQPGL